MPRRAIEDGTHWFLSLFRVEAVQSSSTDSHQNALRSLIAVGEGYTVACTPIYNTLAFAKKASPKKPPQQNWRHKICPSAIYCETPFTARATLSLLLVNTGITSMWTHWRLVVEPLSLPDEGCRDRRITWKQKHLCINIPEVFLIVPFAKRYMQAADNLSQSAM